MKKCVFLFLSICFLSACGVRPENKPETVITTDGEVDDMNSVLRFMYYANDVDLKGIVLTSSTYHYAGDPEKGIEPYRWTGTDWITDFIHRYSEIYPNLQIHADGYPSPDYLTSITKIGNISNVGEMEQVTEGSEFLKQLFLKKDTHELYVQTWGGTNTTARALKSIQEEYQDTDNWDSLKKRISERLTIYIILNQDDSYSNYIALEWPNIKIIHDRSNFWHFAYMWPQNPPQVNQYLKGEWMLPNIKSGHGPLLERYALMGDGNYIDGELDQEQRGMDEYLEQHPEYDRYDFISEGDSPSFLYLIHNGLRSDEDPSYGGWGGRFSWVNDALYENSALDYDPYTNQYEAEYSLMRWFDDIQKDFAARAEWGTATHYADANHYPELSIEEGTDITVHPGDVLTLHANASDPDGDQLSYHWWHYFEADSYQEYTGQRPPVEGEDANTIVSIHQDLGDGEKPDTLVLEGQDSDAVTVYIPEDAKPGDTIHIIAEVEDNALKPMKRYQRVILTVR